MLVCLNIISLAEKKEYLLRRRLLQRAADKYTRPRVGKIVSDIKVEHADALSIGFGFASKRLGCFLAKIGIDLIYSRDRVAFVFYDTDS